MLFFAWEQRFSVVAPPEVVHDRYKALAAIEWTFRTEKTGYLKVRPMYVRKKEHTAAHLFIVTLAYKMERYLRAAWADLNMTVAEGVTALSRLPSVVLTLGKSKPFIFPSLIRSVRHYSIAWGSRYQRSYRIVQPLLSLERNCKNNEN